MTIRNKASYDNKQKLVDTIKVARGEKPCDVVIKDVNFLDVFSGTFKRGDVAIYQDKIVGVGESYDGAQTIDGKGRYLVPGFVDSHVHIESSLMTPAQFERAVLPCGTTTAIWDPHEIANVRGVEGIEWAISQAEILTMDLFVMIPSCVPSTSPELGFETSGATLTAKDVAKFRGHPNVLGLAEMMNFPGLLSGDQDVVNKLFEFKDYKRDGHCPGLRGRDLNAYGVAGIHSCHESTTLEEASEKLTKGIHVLIREGSCAKDAHTLLPLVNSYTSAVLGLCSDDRNPLDIKTEGHINFIVNLALKQGAKPEDVFRAASFGPAKMYGLEDRGAVAPGYKADVVLVEAKSNWRDGFDIVSVFKDGKGTETAPPSNQGLRPQSKGSVPNLNMGPVGIEDFAVKSSKVGEVKAQVVEVIPAQIVTKKKVATLLVAEGKVREDLAKDVLKIAVFERHHNTGGRSVAFVSGFGIKQGAIATSINHDSHNVIVVGSSDELMAKAVNKLLEIDGGIVVASAETTEELACPIGGLMTEKDPDYVSAKLKGLKALARKIGCKLNEPFLQLSFLALPVIPALKITDKGLVDVEQFALVPVLVD
jgi:adenine deaminase